MVSANQSALSEVLHKCQACNKLFKSQEKMQEHKLSKKHKKNQKEYLEKHPDLGDESIFLSISQNQDRSIGALASFDGDAENTILEKPEDKEEKETDPKRKTSL